MKCESGMEKRIKVMHVLNTGGYSGAEHVVIDLIKNTSDKCQNFYVAKEGKIRDVLEKENIDYVPIKKMSVRNIKKQINKLEPDIIHAHDYTAGIICSVFWKKVPVINHLHNNAVWIRKKNIKSIAYFWAARKLSKILTVSESVMDEYIYGKNLLHKTRVVGNPFDISKIRALAAQEMSYQKFDVLFCGRLISLKNPFLFIQIIAALKERIPNIKAAMVGDGDLKEEVNEKIRQLNLENTITLYGFLSNPYGIMRNSRLICIPSQWEGFGLVSLEAMAFGVPVVASPVGGLVNIVDDSCGSLCLDYQDFVDTIYSLMTSLQEYKKKSKGALERAHKMDNLKEYSEKIVGIYGNLADI